MPAPPVPPVLAPAAPAFPPTDVLPPEALGGLPPNVGVVPFPLPPPPVPIAGALPPNCEPPFEIEPPLEPPFEIEPPLASDPPDPELPLTGAPPDAVPTGTLFEVGLLTSAEQAPGSIPSIATTATPRAERRTVKLESRIVSMRCSAFLVTDATLSAPAKLTAERNDGHAQIVRCACSSAGGTNPTPR